jgi:hypothetical protein
MGTRRWIAAAAAAAAIGLTVPALVSADGTETLGPPSIPIATGTGVAVGGVGLEHAQPGVIDVAVPSGATVKQVLLYWEGHSSTANGGDDTVTVNGQDVQGVLIGGPTFFFQTPADGDHYSSTYRADITAYGFVGSGANQLSVGGMDFDQNNNGAGAMVIYDDGTSATVSIVDGNDLAFVWFPAPLNGTVAQTFTFDAEPVDRAAEVSMFFSSVAGPDWAGLRPSTVVVSSGGVVNELVNVLASGDGDEWDTLTVPVTVPAGATSVVLQAFSDDRANTGFLPASFAWNAATLTLTRTPPPPPGGGEGCTPGYWKQRQHFDSWVGYQPSDDFEDVFGVVTGYPAGAQTLLDVLKQGGGGEAALGRHAVAALLNAAGGVDYAYTVAEVIAQVQGAYATGDFGPLKNDFEYQNELGCPLD